MEGRGGHIGWVAAFDSVKPSKGFFPLTALRPYQARLSVPAINYAQCISFPPGARRRQKGVSFGLTSFAPGFCTVSPSASHQLRTGVKGVFLFHLGFHRTAAIKLSRKGLCTLTDRDFLWL